MAKLSDFLEEELLDHVLRDTAYTAPATIYLALYKTDPTDADTGTEVDGAGYARQSVAFNAPEVDGIAMVCKNTSDITFPVAEAAWGEITHVGLRDQLAEDPASNLLWHGALDVSKTIGDEDQFIIKAEDLVAGLQ